MEVISKVICVNNKVLGVLDHNVENALTIGKIYDVYQVDNYGADDCRYLIIDELSRNENDRYWYSCCRFNTIQEYRNKTLNKLLTI